MTKRRPIAWRGLLYAAGFIFLWAWLAVSLRPLDARLAIQIPGWLRPVGWALGIGGAILTTWCVAAFLTEGRGTPAPFDPPREFVASGPYRHVRNPMYLGGFAVLLGAGLASASPAIVLLAGFFWFLAHLFVVLYEEPALERRFGETYVSYNAAVSRWLPVRRH